MLTQHKGEDGCVLEGCLRHHHGVDVDGEEDGGQHQRALAVLTLPALPLSSTVKVRLNCSEHKRLLMSPNELCYTVTMIIPSQ